MKKKILSYAFLAAFLGFPFISASCGNSTTSQVKLANNENLQQTITLNDSYIVDKEIINPFKTIQDRQLIKRQYSALSNFDLLTKYSFDNSRYSGRMRSSFPNFSYQNNFLRQQVIGEFESEVKLDPETLASNIEIKNPGFTKLKFDIGKAIVLELENGQTKTYDNDKVNLVVPRQNSYSSALITLTSDDPASINNLQFKKDLNSALKVYLVPKTEGIWTAIDYQGKGEGNDVYKSMKPRKSFYRFNAKDMALSLLRTELSDFNKRNEAGGSVTLNANYSIANVQDFNSKSNVNNNYLYQLYQVDDKFLNNYQDAEKFISEIVKPVSTGTYAGQQALVFQKKSDSKLSVNFVDFLDYICWSYNLVPASYEYISSMNLRTKFFVDPQTKDNQQLKQARQEEAKKYLDQNFDFWAKKFDVDLNLKTEIKNQISQNLEKLALLFSNEALKTQIRIIFEEILAQQKNISEVEKYLQTLVNDRENLDGKKVKYDASQTEFPSKAVADSGFYWYGREINSTLFSTNFYPAKIDAISPVSLTFLKNPYGPDKPFINSPNSLNLYQIIYPNNNTSFEQAQNSNFQEFFSGRQTFLVSRFIPKDSEKQLDSALKLFNKRSNISINKTKMQNKLFFNPKPLSEAELEKDIFPAKNYKPFLEEKFSAKDDKFYAFNDNFAQLMWGVSVNDLRKTMPNTINHFYAGKGRTFREILSAAVNWYSFALIDALNSNNSALTTWIINMPPDSAIGGTDSETLGDKNIAKNNVEALNQLFVADPKTNKIIFSQTNAQNKAWNLANASNQAESYKAADFVTLKNFTKQFLDEFYREKSLSADQKISYHMVVRGERPIADALKNKFINMFKVFNALDSRLDFTYEGQIESSQEKIAIENVLNWNYDVYSWGYDAENVGSWIVPNLKSSRWDREVLLQALPIYAKLSENATENPYWMVSKMAKKLKTDIDQGIYKFAKSFDDWISIGSQANKDLELIVDKDHQSDIDLFIYDFVKGQTVADNITLAVQINNIVGMHWLQQLFYLDQLNDGFAYSLKGVIGNPSNNTASRLEDLLFYKIKKN